MGRPKKGKAPKGSIKYLGPVDPDKNLPRGNRRGALSRGLLFLGVAAAIVAVCWSALSNAPSVDLTATVERSPGRNSNTAKGGGGVGKGGDKDRDKDKGGPGQHPPRMTTAESRALLTGSKKSARVAFHNDAKDLMILYWKNGDAVSELARLDAGGAIIFNSFTGHVWLWTTANRQFSRAHIVRGTDTKIFSTMPDDVPQEILGVPSDIGVYMNGKVNEMRKDKAATRGKRKQVDSSGKDPDGTSTGAGFSVRFVNNLKVAKGPIDLYWADANHDDKETHLATLMPEGAGNSFNTYVGHVWVMRLSSDQSLVRTIVIDEDSGAGPVFADQSHMTAFHKRYTKAARRAWLNVHPRPEAMHFVHDSGDVGDVIEVATTAPHLHSSDPPAVGEGKVELKVRSTDPLVLTIDQFLSPWECDHIINETLKSGKLKRSTVTTKATIIETRTSSNCWLEFDHDPVLMHVSRRGFETMRIQWQSTEHANKVAESLQVLRYERSQKYDAHHDYFGPFETRYLGDKNIQSGYNRLATLFLYLSDVEEGGETVFPRHGNKYTPDACTSPDGFKVKPKKGSAVLFYSMLRDGNLDENSLHGGCPVIKGTKWAANWWFWDPYRAVHSNPEHRQWMAQPHVDV